MNRVLGLGLDVVDLARFERTLARHGERFVARFSRPGEAKPLVGPPRVAHLAGLFAAKEAVMKALGSGWAEGIGFHQIEIVRAPSGAPSARLSGRARERAAAMGVARLHLSVTHDRGVAAAVAVLEGPGTASAESA